MTADIAPSAGAPQAPVRGASILLAGRLWSIVVLTGFQLLLGRLLTRDEFGAFGYAVSVAAIVSAFITLGTVNALPRVLAVSARQDPTGTVPLVMAFELVLLVVLGSVAVGAAVVASTVFDLEVGGGRLAMTLTVVLMPLAALEAIDRLAETYIAFDGRVRQILFRKYLLGPVLRLASLAVLVWGASARDFALGYVVLSSLGTALYLGLLFDALPIRALAHLGRAGWELARQRIFALLRLGWSVLAHGTLHTFIGFGGAVFLGLLTTTGEVATFRAAAPFSQIIHSLSLTFAIMIQPQIARLAAADDRPGLGQLYWDSALWFAVLSYPLLSLVVVNPDLVMGLAFGGRYDDGAPVLRIVAIGYFVYSALGFHAQTILMFERVGLLLAADAVAAVVLVGANLVLVPAYGAIGAAIAVLATLTILAGCSLAAVHHLGVGPLDRQHRSLYLVMGVALAVGVVGAGLAGWAVGLGLSAVGSLIVVARARRSMRVAETLPELLRVPLLARLLT